MPNRYEREIEEILRNLEEPNSRPAPGQKYTERATRKPNPGVRPPHTFLTWVTNLTPSEKFLGVGIILALIAGGYEYAVRADIFSLVLGIASLICITVVALSHYVLQPRRPRSVRYGNVTITPIRRDPASWFRTQWNLFKLKLQYRRKNPGR
ncbi:hypothetical protein [Tengunoibacter tsumagoiensis]|uniref:Uncharacterized protein n=1 Tax=Tengunoibacter tsumagoiensis TaxID=2014871 RepID=A0A401ZYM0_9CHLR|nr:hypothetical protein [Tengunoibacter tsumagoiensis]GCE11930.1 hypothetical protein KTT_17890 [Tengunoibacter tsumagoiensis]